MTQDALTLARLIGSRICHDLISPVGAIANGMELVELAGTPMTPELELIAGSVAGANARIKFYRVALGAASPEQSLGAAEIRDLLEGYYTDTRITCTWHPEGASPRDEVQAAFLALLCLASAMPLGGEITVTRNETWQITATAPRTKIEPSLWNSLTGAPTSLQPAEVQFALLPACAAAMGRAVSADTGETTLSIRF